MNCAMYGVQHKGWVAMFRYSANLQLDDDYLAYTCLIQIDGWSGLQHVIKTRRPEIDHLG